MIWGLFVRGLGFLFVISFISLVGQVATNSGRDGGLPVGLRLRRIERDFPSVRRFYYFPTLLWLNDSDAMLRALAVVGLGAGVLTIYGGPFGYAGLVGCYVCYLSLDMPVGLIFPWDSLLFESTVLALFLPHIRALPNLEAVSAPAPALAWAYRILLFRLMFGFGKQKFVGSRNKDLSYLKGFLVAQPLPSPLGWYAQKLPTALLRPAVLFMFFAEIPAPFFALFPGWPSLVCAAATAFLMIGIQAMGSFGYFSLLTIVDCLPLLDNVTPRALHVSEMFSSGAPIFTNAFVVLHTVAAVFAFPFNSWIAQSWHLWAFWYRLKWPLQLPFHFLRFMHPLRWVHPYGVFPPNNQPGVKVTLVVEATWDREHWEELELAYSPSKPTSPPRFVAPHHPRGDQAVIYDTFGLNPQSLISSLLGPWDPYPFGAKSAAVGFVQRLMEGKTLGFVSDASFKTHGGPPVLARLTTVMLEPVSLAEHRATGKWWKRTYIGPHTPPNELDPHFWDDYLPDPEMWHFDAIFWRRRSRLRPILDRAATGIEDPLALALVDLDGVTPEDVERFWTEFVPIIGGPHRADFDTLPEVVNDFRARFDRVEQRKFQRLLGRYCMVLAARFEPLYLGRGLKPPLQAKTYFHLWMLASQLVGDGKEAYLAVYRDPLSANEHLPKMTTQTGLYALTLFRFEQTTFEAQKLRLLLAVLYPHDEKVKMAKARMENISSTERLFIRIAIALSAFFDVTPAIRDNFKGPRYDRGYPELYPKFHEFESGEVKVRAYADPPAGVPIPLGGTNAAE